MTLLKIPIISEWREEISKFYALYIENGTYIYGFKENILDYIDYIISLSKKYPIFTHLKHRMEIRFNDIYQYNIKDIYNNLIKKGIPTEDALELSDLIFWTSLEAPALSIILKDKNIGEIYINGNSTPIFINHLKYGNIFTNLIIEKRGLRAIIRLAELIHGEGVARLGGNIEIDINIGDTIFRMVVDTFPLTHGDNYIVIRRMVRKLYDIDELVNNGFLSSRQAQLVLKTMRKMGSVLIAGEPNSGKTTLLNAIVKLLPKNIRKIYFEEARELEDYRFMGNHQVFYRYSGLVNVKHRLTQTIFTLRRSPDYIVIGEILTREDIKTFLDSLLLGFRVAATMHATNIDSLIERFNDTYGRNYVIPLKNLDLIIITERDLLRGRRYVKDMYIVNKSTGKLISNTANVNMELDLLKK